MISIYPFRWRRDVWISADTPHEAAEVIKDLTRDKHGQAIADPSAPKGDEESK